MNRSKMADKSRNLQFIEENFDKINKDKFFRTDYGFEEVYYNPDSVSGGQLVYNEFSFELISEASKEGASDNFYDYLISRCKQYLIDIDTSEFFVFLLSFIEREPDYLDNNEGTARAMICTVREKYA